jgi:DNA polymerase-3 subunit delta
MDSLAFLERAAKSKPQPVYVLHGDEDFLKRRVRDALRARLLGEDDAFGATVLPGDKADFASVAGELATLPFLGPRRVVVVEAADPFVTRERAKLEKYVAAPSATGVLVLEVQTWGAGTRLAKLVPDAATVACKAPAESRLPEWCVSWCAARHGKQLAAAAARLLVDLVGAEMGRLDQELEKLAAYAGDAARIDSADVDMLVGASREKNTWDIFDHIGSGRAGEALSHLDRLFEQGEDPFRLLGAFSSQLRKLAQAARLTTTGSTLHSALDSVGVPPFARDKAEKQMRWIGRRRLSRLYDWLLQTDLGLKGLSTLPPRTLLERLVVQLAQPAAAANRPSARK